MERVQLEVITLSEGVSNSSSYNVLLKEKNGNKKLIMVIGYHDAQSIAVSLEGHYTTRPLTHDLFLQVCKTFNVNLLEVEITDLKEGIYYAKLVCKKGDLIVDFDSRSSDAIALALRFNCPIYIKEKILNNVNIDESSSKQTIEEFEEELEEELRELENINFDEIIKDENENLSINELQEKLQEALQDEDYEKAAKLRDEIEKRSKK